MEFRLEATQSRELNDRLRQTMPAGITRASTFYSPFPLALARGSGCRLWDLDGNAFIDLINNFTALVHGHASPDVVEAIVEQASLGTAFQGPLEAQAELAERIVSRFESIERVRFTNSGFEALTVAVGAARAFTGRDEIVKAHGGFNGTWRQVPASSTGVAGIPQAVLELEHSVDYNDCERLEALMRERGARIAAMLFEPVLGGGGIIPGSVEFFTLAEQLAHKYGALLILDEVITARLSLGGYQATLGVRPDLTTLGKIIGGGLPIGAVGGRVEIMDLFDVTQPKHIFQSGTLNGNPLTMVAGSATLDRLSQSEIDRINELGESLAERLRLAFDEAGLEGTVTACGSLLHVHLGTTGPIRTFKDVNIEHPLLAELHIAALNEGVYYARRGMMSISTPMNEDVINDLVQRLTNAIERVVEVQATIPA